jgi:hypothetical protein
MCGGMPRLAFVLLSTTISLHWLAKYNHKACPELASQAIYEL